MRRAGFLNVISQLYKEQIIDMNEKRVLKNAIVKKDAGLLRSLTEYEVDNDHGKLCRGVLRFLKSGN